MIELKHLGKIYSSASGSVEALKDVNLTIADGEIFGIIGFSGAGKSTLVRCINLLERPTSGTVTVDGKVLTDLPAKELREARKKIGMIFQHFNLMRSRTVGENVAYPLKGSGLTKQQIKAKVKELLELVDIAEKENAYPSQLSGGQCQRVAIARAIVGNPDIILADEPTGNLDSKMGIEVMDLLHQLNKEDGRTIVMVTHNEAQAKQTSRTVRFFDGRQVQ